jgi:transposase
MGEEIVSKIVFVCSDMWEPYLRVIREKCSEAVHILDRFHIVAKINKALDEVRAEETRRMKREGRDPALRKSRWLLLRRSEILDAEQHFRVRDLLPLQLEDRPRLPSQGNLSAALGVQLARLSWQVPRRAVPADHAVSHRADEEDCPLRQHRELILNYFRAQKLISSGVVEGLNNKAKVTMSKSYGFRTYRVLELASTTHLASSPSPS